MLRASSANWHTAIMAAVWLILFAKLGSACSLQRCLAPLPAWLQIGALQQLEYALDLLHKLCRVLCNLLCCEPSNGCIAGTPSAAMVHLASSPTCLQARAG